MAGPGRKEALCNQNPAVLTGIDFVWINPADRRQIAVFFVVEPDVLVRPVDTTATEITATIAGRGDGSTIAIATYAWITRLDASGNPRLTLQIDAQTEGDFQTYLLTLTDLPADNGDPRLDAFCDEIEFSFKQPCPSPFDCRVEKSCPPIDHKDYPVDYLARDFESFRNALLTYAEAEYPQWDAKVPADFGGMISELFAALGDEFSYVQDRFQREGYLSTLTQRRSFDALARLVDYKLDPGQAATGLVLMRAGGGPALHQVPAGARIWAVQEDRPPVPFEVGESVKAMVEGDPTYNVHSLWADIRAYSPDANEPCLPIGSREMFLSNANLLAGPHPPEVLAGDIGAYWQGRTLLLETRPTEPDAPVRRALVTLDEPAQQLNDPLNNSGPLTRIHWRAEDALPFELDLANTFVSANLVPVRAGFSVVEEFVANPGGDPALANFARTTERAGPIRNGGRPVVHRFTLGATVAEGLGWRFETDSAGATSHHPDVHLLQLDPGAGFAPVSDWKVAADGLDFGATDEAVSVEAGHYALIASHERLGVRYDHTDYVDSRGYGLRFGAGIFGRSPVEGDVYRATYRTGPGASANVPEDTIKLVTDPPGYPAALQPFPQPLLDAGLTVTNPFSITNGRDPETLDVGRRIAPAAYKALVYRAVRDADYREQVERLDWVQQARAVTRWTGAWASTFVTADPEGAFDIADDRWDEMQARLSAVRQTGRCAIARQPVFQPLDLRIAICLILGASFGHVADGVLRALSPPGGFFDPENFSFGHALYRPALEAAVANVPGVRAVMEIEIRQRGVGTFQPFTASQLPIADNRILKVENDPNRPGQGSIRVYKETIPALEGV